MNKRIQEQVDFARKAIACQRANGQHEAAAANEARLNEWLAAQQEEARMGPRLRAAARKGLL